MSTQHIIHTPDNEPAELPSERENSNIQIVPETRFKKKLLEPISTTRRVKTDDSILGEKEESIEKSLPGYQKAQYETCLSHLNSLSYTRKVIAPNGEDKYIPYSLFDDLKELKHGNLGIFLYLEFIRRLSMAFFIIMVLSILQIYINYQGDGLSEYKSSFAITLARFTIGNLKDADQKTYIMETAADVLGMIVLFGFYFHWKAYTNYAVNKEEADATILNPSMYAVSVVGFEPKTQNLQKLLNDHFNKLYRETSRNGVGVYEVSIVYDLKRNFHKFIELEELIEKVTKEKELLKVTDKTKEELEKWKLQKEEKEQELSHISSIFEPISAIIHFRNLKAKFQFLNICKRYSLSTSLSSKMKRFFCCIPGIPNKWKFMETQTLMLESNNLPKPDAINWNNIDISTGSYIVRFLISILFIIISIFISSSLIALCTLYVTTTSNCSNFNSSLTLSDIITLNKQLETFCYCSANSALVGSSSDFDNLCKNIEHDIFVSNIIQVCASILSSLTNIILILIISIIAEKLLKPPNKPREYNFIFISVFISNLINSTILPLILNADIYGFRSVNYLGFINFINIQNIAIFKDFDRDWYAVISPYYTNFFIIGSISPLIELIVYSLKRRFTLWRVYRKCENTDPSEFIIQKEADAMIVAFPIDLPTEMAVLCLQFFMCYMYASIIPLAIPIFTFGLILSHFCKRYIILNYTVRIPTDHTINEKIINLIPIILLVHGLMGVWGRTTPGVFDINSFFIVMDVSSANSSIVSRAWMDIILLIATAVILVWIIFDFTLMSLYRAIKESCKDEIEMPVVFAATENMDYGARLSNANILGTYKLEKHPYYMHAYQAYLSLKKKIEDDRRNERQRMMETSMLGFESQPSFLRSTVELMETPAA